MNHRLLFVVSSLLLATACGQAQPTPAPDYLVPTATPELVNAPTPTATPEPTPTATPEPTPAPGILLVHGMEPDIAGVWQRSGTWDDGTVWTDTYFFNGEVVDGTWKTDDYRFERRYDGEIFSVRVGVGWGIGPNPGDITVSFVQNPDDPNDTPAPLVFTGCLLFSTTQQLLCDQLGSPASRQ